MTNKMKNQLDYPLILTAHHIAEILNISKPTAYQLMEEKGFPMIKIGRCKRVLRDDFFAWLNSKTSK